MQTRVRYANIHKAAARPPEPRIQECWERQSHPHGVCSCPHRSVSQVAGPSYNAHAPRRDEGKPPGARRSVPRVKYSMAEKLKGPPPAQSSKGIQSSGQGPRGLGYSPRVPSSLQRPTQTIISGHHFVPHTGKKVLQQGKKGAPKGSSCPPTTYCLPARPKNPGARGQNQQRPRKIVFEDELPVRRPEVTPRLGPQPDKGPTGSSPALHPGHSPQPQLVPDYVLRYPAIYSEAERRRYKAVFQDQHAEYQELRQNVATAMAKFQELEALLATLPQLGPKEGPLWPWRGQVQGLAWPGILSERKKLVLPGSRGNWKGRRGTQFSWRRRPAATT
ncbi:occludin/ELL domain-containing protein 1 isoform X2 [Trichosurus vulpecula]|uniref:occludin/ELL domain-containing protein 1 isoform X2 n=1 Tax=Trichosurus vulpecula TaxID=9337 RepID=UPI00186AEA1E|nr:occludin/ELL domain-containing protein 1 isoform X2 [Trichosurus vulpecula]